MVVGLRKEVSKFWVSKFWVSKFWVSELEL
jgi:hypothetical protein